MSHAFPQAAGFGHRDPRQARRRTAVLSTVAVLHAGVFYMLVTGLAGVVTMINPPPNPVAHNDPLFTPIDPPTAHPKPQPRHPQINHGPVDTTPTPTEVTIDLPPLPPMPAGPGELSPGGTGETLTLPTPTPSPTPAFTPRNAVPRGRPGDWISTTDYPSQDLREGNSGTTGFRLTIGRDGHPQGCAITSSSGHPRLDAITCALALRRAQFKPATDDKGEATAGSFQSRVVWTIPER